MLAAELVLEGVTVRYDAEDPPAVSDCSFRIQAGERVALLGGNGSGKTTILSAIAGLVPHEGSIEVAGVHVEERRLPEVRERIGFLFSTPEDQILFPRVLDDVAFGLVARGEPRESAEAAALEALQQLGVGSTAERSPHRLSHGQRLRVALAGVLITRPPLLLLDEPTGGLDPAGKRLLAEQLDAIPSTILIATHDLGFAARVCDRYLWLEGGRLKQEGAAFRDVDL